MHDPLPHSYRQLPTTPYHIHTDIYPRPLTTFIQTAIHATLPHSCRQLYTTPYHIHTDNYTRPLTTFIQTTIHDPLPHSYRQLYTTPYHIHTDNYPRPLTTFIQTTIHDPLPHSYRQLHRQLHTSTPAMFLLKSNFFYFKFCVKPYKSTKHFSLVNRPKAFLFRLSIAINYQAMKYICFKQNLLGLARNDPMSPSIRLGNIPIKKIRTLFSTHIYIWEMRKKWQFILYTLSPLSEKFKGTYKNTNDLSKPRFKDNKNYFAVELKMNNST